MDLNSIDFSEFESSFLSADVDLNTFKKAEPIKSPEQIRWEWLCQRRGHVTASNYATLMTYPEWLEEPVQPEPRYNLDGQLSKVQPKSVEDRRETLPDGAITYLNKVVSQLMTRPNEERDSGFTSFAMQWGTDTELMAVAELSKDYKIDDTGDNQKFLNYSEYFGGTPDGVIETDGDNEIGYFLPLEIKCPNSDTHAEYLLNIRDAESLKAFEPKYYWQLLGNAQALETDSGLFVSFDPDYHDPFFICHKVWCDFPRSDFELLEKRQELASKYIKNRLQQFENLKLEKTK
jgi:hypothetical protein